MSTPPESVAFPSIPTTTAIIEPTNRRSYRCYNCNYSFHIIPIPATVTVSPNSFRCPRCHHRHLIPHHIISPPMPPPSVPPPSPPTLLPYSSRSFTYYSSDESDSEYESDSDNSLLSFTTPSIQRVTPALKSFVDSLPIKKFDKNLAPPLQSCSICMDSFEIENDSDTSATVTELPCQHYFHKDCISEWLNRSNTCPLCRYQLPMKSGPAQNQSVEEYEAVLAPEEEPVVRRVIEEPGPSLGLNSGSGSSIVMEEVADDSRERSAWVFDAMRDEDGDILMVDA
ncbi:RING-H2 finger protein ATL33-like [Olea europaea var. sylvestris]|uniref:RING-H2 finger protein ATL33-like n=1 Tax=Olea europaea var. sylvestris TaxID=158386 RepID=UPI000C1CE2B4|nr:RING-H2 finger protein ATL33-like [Olea europaea var. sylvestris]